MQAVPKVPYTYYGFELEIVRCRSIDKKAIRYLGAGGALSVAFVIFSRGCTLTLSHELSSSGLHNLLHKAHPKLRYLTCTN